MATSNGEARPMHSMSPVELKRLRVLEGGAVPFLSWREESGAWRFHALDDDAGRNAPLALGRGENADVRVADARVSSLHAELRKAGDHWLVEDAELSRNGTFVNGERISQRRLDDQDAMLGGGHADPVPRSRRQPGAS